MSLFFFSIIISVFEDPGLRDKLGREEYLSNTCLKLSSEEHKVMFSSLMIAKILGPKVEYLDKSKVSFWKDKKPAAANLTLIRVISLEA